MKRVSLTFAALFLGLALLLVFARTVWGVANLEPFRLASWRELALDLLPSLAGGGVLIILFGFVVSLVRNPAAKTASPQSSKEL